MPEQTLLGFDFGLKYIGVAVGQTLLCTARPLTSVRAKHGIPEWSQIDEIIKTWKPHALVVGIPLNMDGTEQAMTRHAKSFAKALKQHYQLPVHTMDERLSSAEARAHLFDQGGFKALKKDAVDSLAAQLILESWLKMQDLSKS